MITKTVYSLYYHETRKVTEELWDGHHHEWYERAYYKHQDAIGGDFLETWCAWSGLGINFEAFPHAYPTNGASEPIKDLILPPGKLHVFAGEYEGYGAIAQARGMEVVTHERRIDAAREVYGEHDQFWISNPSAIDGNVWPKIDDWLDEMRARNPHVRVFLDVTYVGATAEPVKMVPSRHANIAAVVFSLSKPMGVYYHRIGGCVSREHVGTLYGNLWFKNLFSIKLGTALMQRYGVTELPSRYAATQRRAIAIAKRANRIPREAKASDVVLLARSVSDGSDEFRRAPGQYRYCLTQTMDQLIKGELR